MRNRRRSLSSQQGVGAASSEQQTCARMRNEPVFTRPLAPQGTHQPSRARTLQVVNDSASATQGGPSHHLQLNTRLPKGRRGTAPWRRDTSSPMARLCGHGPGTMTLFAWQRAATLGSPVIPFRASHFRTTVQSKKMSASEEEPEPADDLGMPSIVQLHEHYLPTLPHTLKHQLRAACSTALGRCHCAALNACHACSPAPQHRGTHRWLLDCVWRVHALGRADGKHERGVPPGSQCVCTPFCCRPSLATDPIAGRRARHSSVACVCHRCQGRCAIPAQWARRSGCGTPHAGVWWLDRERVGVGGCI